MKSERVPQCVLGNGECPTICPLYKNSADITNAMGDAFDPQESRRRIIFADAFNHNINAIQIALVLSSCKREPRLKKNP